MTRDLTLSQLTTELTDFLGLPADLDLPPVHSVQCKRIAGGDWSASAFLPTSCGDAAAIEAIRAWAAHTGGVVSGGHPYAAPHQPSGMQRTLTLRVVVAEVRVELCTAIDAMSPLPAGVVVS